MFVLPNENRESSIMCCMVWHEIKKLTKDFTARRRRRGEEEEEMRREGTEESERQRCSHFTRHSSLILNHISHAVCTNCRLQHSVFTGLGLSPCIHVLVLSVCYGFKTYFLW